MLYGNIQCTLRHTGEDEMGGVSRSPSHMSVCSWANACHIGHDRTEGVMDALRPNYDTGAGSGYTLLC